MKIGIGKSTKCQNRKACIATSIQQPTLQRRRHKIRYSSYVLLSFFIAFLLCTSPSYAQPSTEKQLFVNGYIHALVQSRTQKNREIALPNATVSLVEFGKFKENNPLAVVKSDLSGRFILKTQKKGLFQICVQAEGFQTNCSNREFVLQDKPVKFGTLHIKVNRSNDQRTASVHGNLELRDGDNPRAFHPLLGVNSFAQVLLSIEGSTKYTAYVNNFGEYIIPSVPIDNHFLLALHIGSEIINRPVDKQTNLNPNRHHVFDFSLRNSKPEVRHVSASVDGKPIQEALPGNEVLLTAVTSDIDNDKLLYRWLLPDGMLVGPTDESSLKWEAPRKKGRYPFTILVSDDRGGFQRRSFSVLVGDDRAPFSGTVVDKAGNPISGAVVVVNGRGVATNSKGRFKLGAPVTDRYVMTIRKNGVSRPSLSAYGTASFVYTTPMQEGRWTLRRAQVFTVDPTRNITLQQSAKFRDCGSLSDQIAWERYLNPRIFQWQNRRGQATSIQDIGSRKDKSLENVAAILGQINPSLPSVFNTLLTRPGQENNNRRIDRRERPKVKRCNDGIKVEIPAYSLVDSNGKPPNGKVKIALSSIDVNASQMPGDFSATDENNRPVSMESFGAGSIEIGDGTKKYNLASDASAIISIPVDSSQLAGGAALPAKVPFLYFDEENGIWEQEGSAELVGTGPNAVYQREVTHFSTLNADILKTGQSCVAVEIDPDAGFIFPLDVEVTMQPAVFNPSVIQVRTLEIDGTTLVGNVIYNLPNDSEIALTPIIEGERPDGSTGLVPAGVFIVNTGGAQTSTSNLPTANADGTYYSEIAGVPSGPCGSRVQLTNLVAPTPDAGFEFLQGLDIQYSSNITELDEIQAGAVIAGAEDYYEHADPRDLRNSFLLFKQTNKFEDAAGNAVPVDAAVGEGEFAAEFANSGDLGFGRDMHCRKNAGTDGEFDYACYVTNYGQPPDDFADQLDADNAHNGINPAATVAMEYSRVENPSSSAAEFPDDERAVKFFVYGNDPNGLPITAADLDDFGERPIPQLCMMCHGGQSATIGIADTNATAGAFAGRSDIMSMGSSFLPFDLALYNFPTNNSKVAQEVAFKNLNEEIVKGVATATDVAGSTGAEIVEIINEFYSGANSNVQVDEPVVTGWDAANPTSDTNRFYREVFATACRTCHIAQPYSAPAYGTSASFQADIGTIQSRVCNQKIMPHARRTHEVFWQSLEPNMPGFLQLYGQAFQGWSDLDDSQCGQFYQGGSAPQSLFTGVIYDILVDKCQSCHATTGNANFVIGNSVDTYNSITTTISNGGDLYIEPGNANASILFQRLSAIGGSLMPLGGLDLGTVDEDNTIGNGIVDKIDIEDWINSGAAGP